MTTPEKAKMRPATEGEEGYASQGMICCGKPVQFEAASFSGVVFAHWQCPICKAEAEYCLGEPKATKAKLLNKKGY